MNKRMIGRILALSLLVEAVFMLPALLFGLLDGETAATQAFALSILCIFAVGGGLLLLCRNAKKGFYAREGLISVGLSWIVISLLGCLPFVLSGAIPRYIDALFEMVSGFTTTGASILRQVEGLPRAVLYWRSFSHWLGGMGVLVFVLVLMPGGGSGYTMHLLRAESPGPSVGKLVPRMRKTATILYGIYILLTLLNIAFLITGGMPWFEAMCTAFGTAGTGGFGVLNDSMASYSPYLQTVTTVFMLLFGVNFSCYYLLLCKNWKSVLKDEELRLYIGIFVCATLIIAVNILRLYNSFAQSLHHAAFQVSSIMTTTGFSTTDFDKWPSLSKGILLMLMITGACAGSTGGGIKCGRVVLLFKSLRANLHQAIHPQDVQVIRMGGGIADDKTVRATNAYLVAYMMIVVLSFLLVSVDGFSITTNLAAVLACFNNIGPGLEAAGPMRNYADFSVLSKLVLILDMLAGRLEIYPILIFASRSAWKR